MLETDKEPDFINEEGVKWWLDKSLTQYANQGDISLEIGVWIVETPDGAITRLATDANQRILKDTSVIEAMACLIDDEKKSREYEKILQKEEKSF